MINDLTCTGDCTECDTCIYDIPLEKIHTEKGGGKMTTTVPYKKNPSTTLLLPSINNGGNKPLSLPIKTNVPKKYCNDCPWCTVRRVHKSTIDMCCKQVEICPGVNKTMKFNTTVDTAVERPEWCPREKEAKKDENVMRQGASMLSPQQQQYWRKAEREKELRIKWQDIEGLLTWDDIEVSKRYHMPPTLNFKRCDLVVERKYIASIQCSVIGTNESRWLYKTNGDWKFLTPLK